MEDNPAWVTGSLVRAARERLEDGVTGLYGDLPPGVGPLLEVAAKLIARAFAAYAAGDWETCDAHLAEGLAASEEVFTALVGHVTSPAWLARVDSPHWVPFVAHMAFMVLEPSAAPAAPEPAPPPTEPIDLAAEMRAMGLM
ncbi:MAG: hypothetical protein ACRDNT_01025 [Streptosporangiaceae bacterium]